MRALMRPQSRDVSRPLRRHHPARWLAEQRRSGKQREASSTSADVVQLLGITQTNVRQQAGQDADVDTLRLRRLAIERQPKRLCGLAKLSNKILPFANAQIMQKLGPAEPAEGVRRQGSLLLLQKRPQVEETEEVGRGVDESTVLVVGCLLVVEWPLTWVLDRQGCSDDDNVGHATLAICFDDHPCQPRVYWQLSQCSTSRREPMSRGVALGLESAEFVQQVDAVTYLTSIGRIDEREGGNVAEVERVSAEN